MLTIVVTAPAAEAEVASDALWALGVVAVEERPSADGQVELRTSLGDDAAFVRESLTGLAWRWRFEEVDDRVVDTWRAHAEPTWIAPDLVIRPAWQPSAEVAGDDVVVVDIDPGATFGMGDHPTTVLTARAMRAVLQRGCSVLDVGCGSGVLAIVACRLGADRAVGIDISPAAVPTTRANAERNGVATQIEVSTTPLAELDGEFDVVVANILAPALIELAADLCRVVATGGALVVSGILASRHDHVVAALAPLRVVRRDDLDGWTALTLRAGEPVTG